MTPIVRSTSRPSWQRLPPKSVFYYRSSKHRNAYVLSFVFVFDEADDEYEFAYTYPYTYTRLQRQLASYDRLALDCCRRELLCRTPQLRRVDVLTICDPPGASRRNLLDPHSSTQLMKIFTPFIIFWKRRASIHYFQMKSRVFRKRVLRAAWLSYPASLLPVLRIFFYGSPSRKMLARLWKHTHDIYAFVSDVVFRCPRRRVSYGGGGAGRGDVRVAERLGSAAGLRFVPQPRPHVPVGSVPDSLALILLASQGCKGP
jgi:hypothetical protein